MDQAPFVANKHIVVSEDDWCRIYPLIYDENGKYQPEIDTVESYWSGPFDIWLCMPEGQTLIDLMEEEGIPFTVE